MNTTQDHEPNAHANGRANRHLNGHANGHLNGHSPTFADRRPGVATGPLRRAAAELGTILSVWAHPDDETYLAAGVMAAARDNGQRVVCVSATAGEHGTPDPTTWPPDRLGRVRRWEAAAAMAVLGVDEHRFLGYEDGALTADDHGGIARIEGLIAEIRPDTVLTFGADGMTFHPDHIAIHHWVTTAWHRRGCPGQVLYAAVSDGFLERFRDQFEEWDMYMSDERPTGVPIDRLAVYTHLTGIDLDRKLAALRAMATQTAGLIAMLDEQTYADQVAEEAFVAARSIGAREPEHVLGHVVQDHLL